MKSGLMISRRALLITFATLPIATRTASAETLSRMTVTKDPSCGCCGAWVDHVRASGFTVEVVESAQMNRVKTRLAVPQDLASCHTAEIGGYVIEGHVPADSIKRLLAEKPGATGLAVPGMPMGSPGMEMDGMEPEIFDVVLFGPEGTRLFARYKGGKVV